MRKQTVLLALERREYIGSLLEMNGFTSGAELGVQVCLRIFVGVAHSHSLLMN